MSKHPTRFGTAQYHTEAVKLVHVTKNYEKSLIKIKKS